MGRRGERLGRALRGGAGRGKARRDRAGLVLWCEAGLGRVSLGVASEAGRGGAR